MAGRRAPGGGRKPKPVAAKIAAGNPGKRKLNLNEPEVTALMIAPPAPEWMGEHARAMWERTAPELVDAKVLAMTDLHVLEGFCVAYDRWRQAEQDTQDNGITIRGPQGYKKNPAVTVANEAMRQMTSYGAALGLDPSSRQRLMVPGAKKTNAFSAVLGGKRGKK